MDTRMNVTQRRRARGAAMPVAITAMAIVVVLVLAAYFLVIRPNQQATYLQKAAIATKQKGPVKVAAPPANVDALSTGELLAEARKALNDQRLLAPAGNNAFSYYLKVLDRQPDNQVAQDALRETFPFGANAAEQAINQGDFAEAQREIALLAKADPDNYTLTILRAKLGAQRKLLAQQNQQKQQQSEQSQATAQSAAEARLAQQQQQNRQQEQAQEAAQREALAKQQAALERKAAQLAARERQQKAAADKAKKAAQPIIQPAVLVHQVQPGYPTMAVRNNQSGVVIVEFTVTTSGDVRNVQVTSSRPSHVFNHAAVSAVRQWKFKPALRNGKPIATTLQRRIRFTLNAR